MTSHPSTFAPARIWALAVLAVLIAAALAAQSAAGLSASVIGADGRTPKPSCPAPPGEAGTDFPAYKGCNAFGHVTGFQLSTDNERAVSKAREAGKIVAWSVNTSIPSEDPYRSFFESNLSDETFDRYGGTPTAGISILKKVGRGRFKLTKKSPIVELDSVLGTNPIFTLKKPLRIKKGRIVALTTPTWVTNLGIAKPGGGAAVPPSFKWRASRKPDRCESERKADGSVDNSNLTGLSHPQVKKGSTKKYGCIYNAAIDYKAYYVPTGR